MLSPLLSTVLVLSCGTAALFDVRRGIIPNWLTVGLLATAAAAALGRIVCADGHPGESSVHVLAGLLAAAAVPAVMYAAGGMGGGDVKLLAALGAWLGWRAGIELMAFSMIFAALHATILVVWRRQGATLARNTVALMSRAFRVGGATAQSPALTELRMAPSIFVALCVVLWGRP